MSAKVLVADPPWNFSDKLPGDGRGAEKFYSTLTPAEICRFPLPFFDPNAVLFLWRVSSQPQEALDVVRTWGFTPKSEIVWVKLSPKSPRVPLDDPEAIAAAIKLHIGMGHIVRGAHETCIVATRGKTSLKPENMGIRTVFFAPVGEHSEKPDEFFQIVEQMFPITEMGTHVELFARKARAGWLQYGADLENGASHPPIAPTDTIPNPPRLEDAAYPHPAVLQLGPGKTITMTDLAASITVRGHKTDIHELGRCTIEEIRLLEKWCRNEATIPERAIEEIKKRRNTPKFAPPVPSSSWGAAAKRAEEHDEPIVEERLEFEFVSRDKTLPREDVAAKNRVLRHALKTGVLSQDKVAGLDLESAWTKLMYAAPSGWFAETKALLEEWPKRLIPIEPSAPAPESPKKGRGGRPKGSKNKDKTNGAGPATANGGWESARAIVAQGENPEQDGFFS